MDKKIALITGASRGLGAALAEVLAPSHHVIAVARTTGALEELDDRIKAKGGQATLAPMDINNADAMAHLCRSIFDRWGKIDFWAHTAVHAAPIGPTATMDEKDWEKSIQLNIKTTGILIPYVTPLLGANGWAMFFDDTHSGEKFFGSYGASKAAQIALAQSWAKECENTGPVVKIMTPPAMPTATRARFFPGEDRSRLNAPSDVAETLLQEYLANQAGSHSKDLPETVCSSMS